MRVSLPIPVEYKGGTVSKSDCESVFFGCGRGISLGREFMLLNCDIVALCEQRVDVLESCKKYLAEGGKAYTNFDEFIEHDMDAVIIANNFDEHAPYVIRCFEKNLHVFCECISNGTMGEAVDLARAFDNSKSIYFMAENYPQMNFNREMQRVIKEGTLGKILFAEGEYNHPTSREDYGFVGFYRFHEKHWRCYSPASYYITHSLGPVMRATGATPKRVCAFGTFAPEAMGYAVQNGDAAAIITTLNDDGSVFRVVGCSHFGAHGNAYRFCGTKGQIENVRGMGDRVMLRYNDWNIPEGGCEAKMYEPHVPDKDDATRPKGGHGGADYLTCRMFVECVREGRQPEHPFDLYSAINMSSVGLPAHRSVLEGGKVFDIPDFRTEEARKQYENDRLTPFWGEDGSAPTLPCCSHPDYTTPPEDLEKFHGLLEKYKQKKEN